MHALSSDASSFRRSAPNKALPVHVVKYMLARILEGLAQLHELDIIHTGALRRLLHASLF
jgi:serine/threonine-protein kinase SRPK3